MAIPKRKAQIIPFPQKEVLPGFTQKKEETEKTVICNSGKARCLKCHNEWDAVMLIGTTDFLCPNCKTYSGVFVYFTEVQGDSQYACGKCDNRLFYVMNDGDFQCPVCGTIMLIDDNED